MNNIKKLFALILLFIFSFQFTFASESYKLTIKDKILITNISTKINLLADKKWDIIVSKYVAAIDKALKKTKKDSKINIILTSIKTKIIAYSQEKYKKEIEIEDIKKEEIKNESWYESKTNFTDFKIDINKVRESWLWYFNSVRKNKWRDLYSFDSKLNDSAQEWSDTSLSRWIMSHKRDENDSYYNYNKITSWFKDRWVVCKNINRTTNSENIWRWYYSCSDWNDCTDKLISWTKEVFDFYMDEKGKSNQVHYESVVKKEFNKIWVWIAIKKSWENNYEFYITTHYCTELEK